MSATPDITLARRLGPLGAGLPQVGPGGIERSDHGSVAGAAESAGYRGLWVCELTTAPVLDPIVQLAHAAGRTTDALLGVAVLLAPLHTPLRLANQLASLDVLSGGRLAVGLGFGSNPALYPRYGLDADRRLDRYLDTIDLVQRLWRSNDLDYDNGMWSLDGPTNVVAPVQRPRPPLFIGARKPAAIQRCARLGDGWVVSGSAPPEEVAAGRDVLRRTLDELGRDPATFTIARRVYVAVDNDAARAQTRLKEWFAENYGKPEIADSSAVAGSLEEVTDVIGGLHQSGIDHVIVNPVFDELEQLVAVAEAYR